MIFYFTGTGNGKYLAERLAEGTNDQIFNIADCIQNGQISFDLQENEALGFVLPVYFMGIPIIASEFLKKLQVNSKNYSFLVLDCGGTTANAVKIFQKLYSVDAVFAIKMPDNYVPLYKVSEQSEIENRLNKADSALVNIIEKINNKQTGNFNSLRGKLPRLLTLIGYPMYKKGRKTKNFSVTEACTACGLCERICPRKAISVKDGKPHWTIPQCEICFGCLHRCPTAAINYGKSAKNGRYVNPRVKF